MKDTDNSRQRVMTALEHKIPDSVPKDLGGMGSTGISTFAYPKLVQALGLPPRRPRVYDTFQMLALPDSDVLEALGCDVVTVFSDQATNAFDEPERWFDYDFNGRLSARIMTPGAFRVETGGIITRDGARIVRSTGVGRREQMRPARMVPGSILHGKGGHVLRPGCRPEIPGGDSRVVDDVYE